MASRRSRSVVLAVALGTAAAAALVAAAPAYATAYGSDVDAGTRLVAGDTMTAQGGAFTLTVQTDGNVVERHGATAVWTTRTVGNPGAALDIQTDGNLVVRSSAGRALWTSGTSGHPAGDLYLQDNGALLVMPATSGGQIWSNGVGTPVRLTTLASGRSIRSDSTDPRLYSPGGRFEFDVSKGSVSVDEWVDEFGTDTWYRDDEATGGAGTTSVLTMQTDGNLVLRGIDGAVYWASGTRGAGNRLAMQDDGNLVMRRANGSAVWSSGTTRVLLGEGETAGPGTRFVDHRLVWEPGNVTTVQSDGNVVRRGSDNSVLWTTGTSGNPGAKLTMQGDGNLVVRRPDGRAVWQSGTSHCGPGTVFNSATGSINPPGTAQTAWWEGQGGTGLC